MEVSRIFVSFYLKIDFKRLSSIHLAVEFSCLGDWFVGKNHYFAVANTKESRKDEKFRCFLKNRDDDEYMGKSITPECNTLKSPEDSPERYRMTPGKLFVIFFVFRKLYVAIISNISQISEIGDCNTWL